MGLEPRGLDKLLTRTLKGVERRSLVTPVLEKAIMLADWPDEFVIRVYRKERIWDGLFHPSSDAAADPLYLFYKFRDHDALHQERNDPTTEMTFLFGDAVHALMQSMAVHLGLTVAEECEKPYTRMDRHSSGTLDIRRLWLPHGEIVPVEFKSCSWVPKEPQDNHVRQLQLYLDLGDDEPRERGSLLYVEKAYPHRLMEFVVNRDEKILADIYSKWERVLEALEFDDPDSLTPCCMAQSQQHHACPARYMCRIGSPAPSGVG